MTEELLALIRAEEGLRLDPYLCPAGYPTIGYGHRIPSMDEKPWTEAQADQQLKADVMQAEQGARTLAPHLDGRRLAALTDLVFNVGRAALVGSGVVRCLNAEDWAGAAARFRKWNHGRVAGELKELPGLTRRRNTAARWIEEG